MTAGRLSPILTLNRPLALRQGRILGGGRGQSFRGQFYGGNFPVTGPHVLSNILSLGLMASQTEARLILKK